MRFCEHMNRKPLGILMITPFFRPNIGGVETHLDGLCKYLRDRGHKVFVLTYQPLTTRVKAQNFEKKQNLEIRRIGWFGYNLFHKLESYPLLEFTYLTPMLLIYSLFFCLSRKKYVDVIHAHGLNASFVAEVLAKVFRKKAIVSLHAIYNLSKRPMLTKLMKVVLSSYGAILTLSNKSKMELTKMGLDSEKIRVFTYWVDQTLFKPINKAKCRKEFGLEGKFIVLFIGRLIEIKGVRLLIRVAKKLSAIEDVYFVFIGDGPLTGEVKAASNNFGNIIYVGEVENKELSPYYNAADVVIVPSLYEEGFGRVILEALSCGTPVIASNRGGIPEALDESVGMLIEPEVDEIVQTVESLYESPEKLANLRRNCRAYAIKKFSEDNATAIEDAYR